MGDDIQQTRLNFFDTEKIQVLKDICLNSIRGDEESEILLKKIEKYITEKKGKRK